MERILSGPNYYLCHNNSCLVLILQEGTDESVLRQVAALFHDIKIAVGSVETSLNRSFEMCIRDSPGCGRSAG